MVVTAPPQSSSGSASTAPPAQSNFVRNFMQSTGFHREVIQDTTVTLTAADQPQTQISVNAYGFMAALRLIVTTTTAAVTTGAAVTEDGPFNAVKFFSLVPPSGNVPLINLDSLYSGYLIHKYGGYGGFEDIRADTSSYVYSAGGGTGGSIGFEMRFPIMLNLRNALMSLPNKASNATFKINWTVAALSNFLTTTGVTTFPAVRFRWILESWDPPAGSVNGISNTLTPPANDSAQYWTYNTYPVNAGQQSPLYNGRMGNTIRMPIWILRRNGAGTPRQSGDADWPDPVQLSLDARNSDLIYKTDWQHDIYNMWGYAAGSPETAGNRDYGVYPYPYYARDWDGRFGRELGQQYLQTIEGTRYQQTGTFGNAGTITMLTNDLVPTQSLFTGPNATGVGG